MNDNAIDRLFVNLKYQNRGYGKKILASAVALMQQRKESKIVLSVANWNQKAVQLYLDIGFEIMSSELVDWKTNSD